MLKDILDAHCETSLYTLKFHLLHDLIKDMDRFGCLELLRSPLYKRFSAHVKMSKPLDRTETCICSQGHFVRSWHEYLQQKTEATQNTIDHDKHSNRIIALVCNTGLFLVRNRSETNMNCRAKSVPKESCSGKRWIGGRKPAGITRKRYHENNN